MEVFKSRYIELAVRRDDVRTGPATLLISGLRSASSVFPPPGSLRSWLNVEPKSATSSPLEEDAT